MSDGRCTFWFDGWPTWLGGSGNEWLHCCLDHDAAFDAGVVTLTTHIKLGACVAASAGGPLMGLIMTFATAVWWVLTRTRSKARD